MKIAIGLALALALALFSVPATAGDTFHALSSTDQTSLTPLSDEQLAAIEGYGSDVCVVCINAAVITQVNVNILSFDEVEQENEAEVNQSIN